MQQHVILQLQGIKPNTSNPQRVLIDNFTISEGETWAVVGGNGSGKSTFAQFLSGNLYLAADQRIAKAQNIQRISFEQEQQLYEREIREDDSEFINAIDAGRTTYQLITEHLEPAVDLDQIILDLQLENFLHTGFRLLSTGERRRMMIARALAQKPDLLILDEPFDGIDKEMTQTLKELLEKLSSEIQLVVIVNRMSHVLEATTHIACLSQMELVLQGTKLDIQKSELWNQLESQQTNKRTLPNCLANTQQFTPTEGEAIVDLRKLTVGYHNKPIIEQLDWQTMPHEHWRVKGPNGCGKSTLVNIISGDHPQCYSNEIYLFGKKRGLGESIWEVKHFMGLMSTTLHQAYRITVTAETVLLSGFFDTIGVYRPVSPAHRAIANEWLNFLGLTKHKDSHFHSLSFGQQRMLLIARALIKRPYLLILDEPCQGLDPINRALVIQLIEWIAEQKIAQIIYISHEEEDQLKCLTHELSFEPHTPSSPETPSYGIETKAL